jgi:hypothetical protein
MTKGITMNVNIDETIRRFRGLLEGWNRNLDACNLAIKNYKYPDSAEESLDEIIRRKNYIDGRIAGLSVAINELEALQQGY